MIISKHKSSSIDDFEVYYDDGDYRRNSKVYAVDTTRYRFLVCNSYNGKFLWVDIKDCMLVEDEKDD